MKRKKLELTITVIIYLMVALAASALSIGALKSYGKLTPEFRAGNMWLTAVLPAVIAECVAMTISLYDGKYSFERDRFLTYVWKALKSTIYFVGVWAAVLLIQKNNITASRYFFTSTVALHFVLLSIVLYEAQRFIILNFYKTDAASLVAVIASREDAVKASQAVKGDWSRRIVGIMLTDEVNPGVKEEIDHVPVTAYGEDIVRAVRASAIDEVFVFGYDINSTGLAGIIEELTQMGVSVHLNISAIERLSNRLSDSNKQYIPKLETRLGFFDVYPMAIIEPPAVKIRYELLKRLMDILGGLVGALVAAVLFVIVGIAIKLDSPGPVVFAQERIGKNGRRFKMYKFRSMYIDAEERKAELMKQNEMSGLMFKMKDDPRITKVGKFIRKTSLDEFPQFFNVLMGDMSLVGTRPPTVGEFNEYSNYHKRRLSMKPGITGMWQVSGRSDITDFEEVVKLDCKYIDNWSVGLDVKILIQTVLAVVMRKGSE